MSGPRSRAALILLVGVGAARAAFGAQVPDVAVEAGTIEAAPAVTAPISEVTVYSDRARVRRRGTASLPAGVTVIRFPDLPGATFVDTIRLSAGGARTLRVEAVPRQRERLAIDRARKLLDDLDAAEDRLSELDDQVALEDWLGALLLRLKPAAPVGEAAREGRKALVVDVPSWWKALDFLGQRATAARTRVAALADERRVAAEERDRLRADIAALDRGGFSTRVVEVSAVVEASAAGKADLQLEYFIPGARWRPAYDLHYASARGQIRVETAAVVDQTTGEDWEHAALSLSTAMPARGIDLPELLTWTLGERSEFVPRSQPRQPPPLEPPPTLPLPPEPSPETRARNLDVQLLRERLGRVIIAAQTGTYELRKRMASDEEQGDGAVRAKAPPPARPRAMKAKSNGFFNAPAGAPSAAPAMEPEEESAPAPSVLVSAQAVRRSSISGNSVSTVPLALTDATAARRPPPLGDPYLPAVSAGGLDHVYVAPAPATIPSTGQQIRIPLASQTFRAAAYHEATPALAATAFLRARVRNDGKLPLLRGPATIFGDGELVGVGEIQTTGPGGDIELPLGADQDVRLVRQIVPSTKTTGLIMKADETTYDVQIQIGNYKKQPIRIDVIDQIPTSHRDQVQVKLLSTDPAPQAAPDADGVLRWRVDLAPGATRTVRLRYQIVRPKDWVLFQR